MVAEIKHSKPWRIELAINNIAVKLKMDFGDNTNAIPENIYRRMDLPALVAAREMLHISRHNPLNVTGKPKATIQGNKG